MQAVTVTDPASFSSVSDEALNTGNIDLLLGLYEEQASFRASDGAISKGHQALRQEMESLIAAKAKLHNQLRHLMQTDGTALIVVDWTLQLDVPGSGLIVNRGTATNVLRYSAEAGWRMLIANPQGTA